MALHQKVLHKVYVVVGLIATSKSFLSLPDIIELEKQNRTIVVYT